MDNNFKPIPGHTRYEISDTGQIKFRDFTAIYSDGSTDTVVGSYLTPYMSNGISRIRIDGVDYAVHRLVAQVHVPNPNNDMYVKHIDGNTQNNCASNLMWYSGKQNNYDRYKKLYGTAPGTKVMCQDDGSIFRSIQQAANYYNLSYSQLCYAVSHNRPIKGHMFSYTNLEPNRFIDSCEFFR